MSSINLVSWCKNWGSHSTPSRYQKTSLFCQNDGPSLFCIFYHLVQPFYLSWSILCSLLPFSSASCGWGLLIDWTAPKHTFYCPRGSIAVRVGIHTKLTLHATLHAFTHVCVSVRSVVYPETCSAEDHIRGCFHFCRALHVDLACQFELDWPKYRLNALCNGQVLCGVTWTENHRNSPWKECASECTKLLKTPWGVRPIVVISQTHWLVSQERLTLGVGISSFIEYTVVPSDERWF